MQLITPDTPAPHSVLLGGSGSLGSGTLNLLVTDASNKRVVVGRIVDVVIGQVGTWVVCFDDIFTD